jgi:hypothetical protein
MERLQAAHSRAGLAARPAHGIVRASREESAMLRTLMLLPAMALPALAAAADLSRSEIREATAALAVAGYGQGPVDGDWDTHDAAALKAYQADWQLPETGEPTPEMLARLSREHAATRPQWVETDGGCRVWNRFPQARETVSWTGPCIGGRTAGEGTLTWTSVLRGRERVETYRGARRAGREHGRGVYLGADGSRYEGDWRLGIKHGEGTWTSPEGHVYVGEYREGLRQGHGVYTLANGSRYEGEWWGGKQHGVGTAVWHDGSRYEGRLADGKPDGQGTLTFADGTVYSGEWRAGCFAEPTRGATAGVTPADCGWE